jgi:transcription-repair coupling factor (superfamily II helicase)
MQELDAWRREWRQTLLCFHSEQSRRKFMQLAPGRPGLQDGLRPGESGIFALVGSLGTACAFPGRASRSCPSPCSSRGAPKAQRAASKAFKGLDAFDELEQGDLLVHRDYGLCRFGGCSASIRDVANDYLLLQYDGEDRLYLPVDRLGQVQR